ncbi:MAG: YggT family protein [Gemmatimonadetes bacterium]|nr:YggT family protein [Gemmatimonadota bacterium]MCC6772206.1 YggT family protein [Gemmatimonadaceae bacterium]
MPSLLLALDSIRAVLGQLFLVLGVGLALVCAIDWMVRTRRLNPFGAVARAFRQSVEPLMAPVERRIVAAGGVPSNAPWWALGAVVVIGIVFLALFDFVRSQLGGFYYASQAGPRGVVRMVVGWVFALLRIALIVRVFSSWVRVSAYSKWIRWSYTLTEPILRPLRQVVPTLGMIDITPIIAYVLISLLEGLVVRSI